MLILPRFGCRCGKEYDTLSSLTNHIKNEHNNQQKQYRLPRGVPGGRNKKIQKSEKLYLEKVCQMDLDQSQQLSEDEIRMIFQQINNLILNIVREHRVEKFETELQRENIRLQPFWIKIKTNKILEMMEKYLLSFLMFACKQNIQIPVKYENDDIFSSLKDCLMDEDTNSESSELTYINRESLKMEEIKIENNNQYDDEFREQFISKHLSNNQAFLNVAQR
ncbi:hypothetical protein ABPG74_011401 [Tetrahymena malaccensis]